MQAEEPLITKLIFVSKNYLSAFSSFVEDLPIERYQYVLVLIAEKDEKLTQKALSELLKIDKSYMVSIINYLSDRGCVYREKNPEDRREQIIRLTEKAHQILPTIKKAFDRVNKQSFKNLSSEQIKSFYDTLNIVQANLSNSNPDTIIFNIKRLSNKA